MACLVSEHRWIIERILKLQAFPVGYKYDIWEYNWPTLHTGLGYVDLIQWVHSPHQEDLKDFWMQSEAPFSRIQDVFR